MNIPIYNRLILVGSDEKDATVTVALAVSDETPIRVDMEYPIAVATLGALQAEVMKLASQLPEEEREKAVILNTEDVSLSLSNEGLPLVVITLKGGAPLGFHIDAASLRSFAQEAMLLVQAPLGRAQ